MNLVNEWKKKLIWLSSELNPNRTLTINRDALSSIERILYTFWGEEYFEINQETTYPKISNPEGSNWLYFLLSNHTLNTIKQIIELTAIIDFYQRKDPKLLENLKSQQNLKNFRGFRNYLFELYTFYLLDSNGVINQKKVYEGNLELEGECEILDRTCLFECRKLYSFDVPTLGTLTHIISEVNRLFEKYAFPLVGLVNIDEADKSIKNTFGNTFEKYMKGCIKNDSNIFHALHELTNNGKTEVYLQPYQPGVYDFLKKNKTKGNFIIFQLIPPDTIIPSKNNKFRVMSETGLNTPDEKIAKFLVKQINKKRKRRSNSKYDIRIYLFENEYYGGLDMPPIPPSGLSDTMINQIKNYLNNKKTNDIIVFIMKDLTKNTDKRIEVKVFGKESLNDIKSEILKWDFDFSKK